MPSICDNIFNALTFFCPKDDNIFSNAKTKVVEQSFFNLDKSLFRWYFGKIKRIEAEKKLLLPQNEHGAYLIRDSESRRNDYSLSVRDGDTVKHYRIRQLDEGGFFIARRTTFRY